MQRHAGVSLIYFHYHVQLCRWRYFSPPQIGKGTLPEINKVVSSPTVGTFWKILYSSLANPPVEILFSPYPRGRGIRQRTADAKPGRLCRDISLYDSNCELMTHWPNSGLQQSAICIPYYLFRVLAVIPTQLIHIHAALQFLREFSGVLVGSQY